jgi:enoyl-CoA hydratase/carnithine racemase
VRLQRSVGRALAQLEKPTVTYLHGPCMGSGIELAAFTGTVVGAPDTTLALPEIGLGLVPGAGGTVSLTRRIGRLHTASLAFSAEPIDVWTAKEWGLVDRIEP